MELRGDVEKFSNFDENLTNLNAMMSGLSNLMRKNMEELNQKIEE